MRRDGACHDGTLTDDLGWITFSHFSHTVSCSYQNKLLFFYNSNSWDINLFLSVKPILE